MLLLFGPCLASLMASGKHLRRGGCPGRAHGCCTSTGMACALGGRSTVTGHCFSVIPGWAVPDLRSTVAPSHASTTEFSFRARIPSQVRLCIGDLWQALTVVVFSLCPCQAARHQYLFQSPLTGLRCRSAKTDSSQDLWLMKAGSNWCWAHYRAGTGSGDR